MKKIHGECDFKFSFPDDYRFKDLTRKQRTEYFKKAVTSILTKGNLKVSRVRVGLDEEST